MQATPRQELASARESTVLRTRLVERARRALDGGGLVLTAGAGFGKTTVLEQALAGSPNPIAWLSCGDADRDPGLLIVRVARALAAAVPGATDALVDRLAATEQIDAEAVTEEMASELRRLLIEPVVLVFDDAERLDGARESLAVVARLIRADLPALHVAVATRVRLKLRAGRGSHTPWPELSAEDLVFSGEECAELLRERTGGGPSGRIDEVMEATQGWPLGVAVATDLVARGREHGDPAAPLGALRSAPALRSYLSGEVLRRLDRDHRRAALRASAAERVTPAVKRALDLPTDLAVQIERAGLPMHRSGDAFAYHPLLREFLLERLEDELEPAERRALHAALARAATEDGDPVNAVERWLEAERWDEAAAAIEVHGFEIVRTSPTLVRGWIAKLPADFRTRPTLRGLEGHSLWLGGEFPQALPALRAAVRGFGSHPNPPAEWLARSILVDVMFATGDPDGLESAIEDWDEPSAAGAFALAPAAAMYAASCLAAFGRVDVSDRLAAAALASEHSEWIAPFDALRRMFIDSAAGNLDEVCARLEGAVRELERIDPLNRLGHALGALAVAEAERGEREKALRLWRKIRDGMRGLAAPVLTDATHAWCALLHAQAGRLEDAEAELAQHRRLETGARSFIADLAPATVAALRGDAEAVEKSASAMLLSLDGGPVALRCVASADLVPALAGVDRLARAGEVVEAGLVEVDAAYPGERGAFLRGRLLAQRAWLAHLDGRPEAADDALLATRAAAGPAARHVLRREWERLQPVVWDALARQRLDAQTAVAEIEGAFPGGRELVAFLDHPSPAVRAAALEPAVRSGDPSALTAVERMRSGPEPELAQAADRAVGRLARMLPPLRFTVLGGFGVARGSWVADEAAWQRPIDARLVRLLLTQLGTPLPEGVLFEALWPELSEQSARRSLQVAASRARKVLDPPGAERSVIEAHNHCYRLVPGRRGTVDAEDFRSAASAALEAGDVDERRARLERARALWVGEPMPEERYSSWAVSYQEGLKDLHAAVLATLTRIYDQAGEHLAAAAAARELVEIDPFDEGAHRSLMTAYARAGRTGHALRQYLECRRTLVEELGTEPAQATATLQARILAGEAV